MLLVHYALLLYNLKFLPYWLTHFLACIGIFQGFVPNRNTQSSPVLGASDASTTCSLHMFEGGRRRRLQQCESVKVLKYKIIHEWKMSKCMEKYPLYHNGNDVIGKLLSCLYKDLSYVSMFTM